MYIKLGKTRINYLTPSTNDDTILSEVIKSKIQYQNPVYVRNLDELNIWFGQDFQEYTYFSELLNNNATLYLVGPLSSDRLIDESAGEVDYYSWTNKEVTTLPETGEDKTIYELKTTHDKFIWYKISDKDNTYAFVNVLELPQELQSFKSKSQNNRDTLVIWNDNDGVVYVSPSYGEHTLPEEYDLSKVDLSDLDSSDLKNGKQSLVFEFKEDTEKKDRYIVFGKNCYYWGNKPELGEYKYEYLPQTTNTSLEDVLKGQEFIISGSLAYSKTIRPATYFTKNITFAPLYTESSNVVYEKKIDNTETTRVEITSKTLGTDELNPITVSYDSDSEELNFSRFDYTEYYFQQEGIDFYDDISNRSKLVDCEVFGDFEWSNGNWSMSGAIDEGIKDLSTSLNVLTSNDVQSDFLFIDSYSDYSSIGIITEDRDSVKSLLSGVIEKWPNTQILVQNTSSDFQYNYLEDYNKIMYFFNSMQLTGEYRPGWYIFLNGLLNNNYEFKTSTITYPDLIQDLVNKWIIDGRKLEIRNFIEKWYVKEGKNDISYDEELKKRKKELENYKSNYLTSADYYYFYEKFFDGENYETSGLLRFILFKVNRELVKNFEGFIGEQDYSNIRDLLTSILKKVLSCCRLINNIYITNFTINNRYNSLKITIQIEMSDLEKNDIITDIEINYNK